MIQLFPQQLPPNQSQWVIGQQVTTRVFYFLKALFDRTGGNSGVFQTAGSGLTVSSSPLTLTEDFSEILSGSGDVSLSAIKPGQWQVVYNGLAGNLNVLPASGGQIDALAVDAPYVLATGKSQFFWCASLLASGGSFYRSLQLG